MQGLQQRQICLEVLQDHELGFVNEGGFLRGPRTHVVLAVGKYWQRC
jgi:hypothetical protein